MVVGILVAPDSEGTWRVLEAAPYVRRRVAQGMPARAAWDLLAAQGWALQWVPQS